MKESLAEYWANACLGYALVLFGANVLDQWSSGSSEGPWSLLISGVLMVALLIVGAWLASRSKSAEG